ncbi:MAG: hypothetical protein HQK86_14175 [Nitrospinae bacterium]|nr:hypothetical protein [Nitrospinota bacterium]
MLRAVKQERFAPSHKKVMAMSPKLMMGKAMRHRKMLQTIRGGHRHMTGNRRGMK